MSNAPWQYFPELSSDCLELIASRLLDIRYITLGGNAISVRR